MSMYQTPIPPSASGPPTQPTGGAPSSAKTSGMAIASLVLGILGFCTAGLAGIIGIILGIVALSGIKKNAGSLRGNGLAIAGISVGAASLLFGCLSLSLVIPAINQARIKARQSIAAAECRIIVKSTNLYLMDVGGRSPEEAMDLNVLLLPQSAGGGRNGPYLEKAEDLIDPWGHPYVLRVPGQVNTTFDIVSYGADGRPGGRGEDSDITN